MSEPYTYVPKPTGSPYTLVNPVGKQMYDESSITYDDSSTYYDGVNPNAYTYVPKPVTSLVTSTNGLYYGFGSFTYVAGEVIVPGEWVNVPKPTNP